MLIRKAVRAGRSLGLDGDCPGNLGGAFVPVIARKVIEMSSHIDLEVKDKAPRILEVLQREELVFMKTLRKGGKKLDRMLKALWEKSGSKPCLPGKAAFVLKDTYGFPVEETREVAEKHGIGIDIEGFDTEMESQRHQSKASHSTVKPVGCT